MVNGISDLLQRGQNFVSNIGVGSGNTANRGNAKLAQLLLQQSNTTRNPLVAALTGFTGGVALGNIGRVTAEQEAAEKAKEAELKEREFGLEEDKLGLLKGETAANIRLANARTRKVLSEMSQGGLTLQQDQKTGNTLLFKGNAPVTDGLDKGMQWAVNPEGQRVAVPIPAEPSEKAAAIKDNTLAVAKRLLKNKEGIKSNFGAVDKFLPNVTSDAMQAETDLNQLRALLTVENLGLMSGVLSETDIKILQNVAGGGLADTATQEGAVKAIEDIVRGLGGEIDSESTKKVPELPSLPSPQKIKKFNPQTGKIE